MIVQDNLLTTLVWDNLLTKKFYEQYNEQALWRKCHKQQACNKQAAGKQQAAILS